MSESDCTTLAKVCTKCGRERPATREYFHVRAGSELQSWCKECFAVYNAARHVARRAEKAAYDAAYRATHREEIAAYRADHSEELAACAAAYRADHREERRANNVAYNAAHREEGAAYRAAHREELAAYRVGRRDVRAAQHAAWHAEHPESRAAYERNRRARKLGNGGTHTADDVRAQYARQNGRCYWCKGKVGDTYHVDHVMPVILGGSNGPENLVIACPTCNLSKGAKHPQEFGRLL